MPEREHLHQISTRIWESHVRIQRLKLQAREPRFIRLRNLPQGTERQAGHAVLSSIRAQLPAQGCRSSRATAQARRSRLPGGYSRSYPSSPLQPLAVLKFPCPLKKSLITGNF